MTRNRTTFLAALALAAGLGMGLLAAPATAADDHGTRGVPTPNQVANTTGDLAHPSHGAEAHGDPALIGGPKTGLITAATTLIIFLLLLTVLGKFAWGPIASGLKAREDKIRKDIADAEAARARAEATLREYNTKLADAEGRTREILAKATADAERLATSIRMQAQQEAEEAKERAMKDIDAARKDAVREVYEQTAVLATNVAEKILRRSLNAQDQRDLVDQSLNQLQAATAGGERHGTARAY